MTASTPGWAQPANGKLRYYTTPPAVGQYIGQRIRVPRLLGPGTMVVEWSGSAWTICVGESMAILAADVSYTSVSGDVGANVYLASFTIPAGMIPERAIMSFGLAMFQSAGATAAIVRTFLGNNFLATSTFSGSTNGAVIYSDRRFIRRASDAFRMSSQTAQDYIATGGESSFVVSANLSSDTAFAAGVIPNEAGDVFKLNSFYLSRDA